MPPTDIRKIFQLERVFVYGDFYVLHPGHVRFLKFAAGCGDKLYIGINNSQPNPNFPTPKERLETLQLERLVSLDHQSQRQLLHQN